MANLLTGNPIVIDTPDSIPLITYDIYPYKIRWVGGSTAGHQVVVQDKDDKTFWESVASGANHVEESDFTTYRGTRRTLHGLQVPTLGSGKLYIYQ